MKMISKQNKRFTSFNGNYTLWISTEYNGMRITAHLNSNSPLNKELVKELIKVISVNFDNDINILDNLELVIKDYLYKDNNFNDIRFITNAGLKNIIEEEKALNDNTDLYIDNEGMGILKRYVLDKIDMEQVQELAKAHKLKYIKLPQALLFKEYVRGLK